MILLRILFVTRISQSCSFTSFIQDLIATQVPAANVDQDELRRKFGAMVSSVILNDSHAASSSGVAVLPSSKAAPVPKARADANVR
jgi:hypothetical protein